MMIYPETDLETAMEFCCLPANGCCHSGFTGYRLKRRYW
jgi:hypothetical protein